MNSEQKLLRATHRYRRLQQNLSDLPWILSGTVREVQQLPDSPTAKTTYVWTRKVKAKTVSVALSKEQFLAFRKAIDANRKLEKTLKQMRELSQDTLLNTILGVKRKPRRPSRESVQSPP
jgi:hypothetical protein